MKNAQTLLCLMAFGSSALTAPAWADSASQLTTTTAAPFPAPAPIPQQTPAQQPTVQQQPAQQNTQQPPSNTVVNAPPAPPPAPSQDLTSALVSPACLSISSTHAEAGPGSYSASGVTASDPSGDGKLAIASTHVTGQLAGDSLRGLNDLAAIGAIAALEGRTSQACQDATTSALEHSLASQIANGASPHLSWRGITLTHEKHQITAETLDASIAPDSTPQRLRLTVSLGGLHDSTTILMPNTASLDIAAPASELLTLGSGGETVPITINGLHATLGNTNLSASGRASVAADRHDTNADLAVAVTGLSNLIDLAHNADQQMLTTALSVGQLVGRKSGDQVSWDVKYTDGLLLINNIPVPLSVH